MKTCLGWISGLLACSIKARQALFDVEIFPLRGRPRGQSRFRRGRQWQKRTKSYQRCAAVGCVNQ